mgnify:FL=1
MSRLVHRVEGAILDADPAGPSIRLPGGVRLGLGSEVAVLVVELCARPRTLGDIAQRVSDLYEVDPAQARRDVGAFVDVLIAEGALEALPLPVRTHDGLLGVA